MNSTAARALRDVAGAAAAAALVRRPRHAGLVGVGARVRRDGELLVHGGPHARRRVQRDLQHLLRRRRQWLEGGRCSHLITLAPTRTYWTTARDASFCATTPEA